MPKTTFLIVRSSPVSVTIPAVILEEFDAITCPFCGKTITPGEAAP